MTVTFNKAVKVGDSRGTDQTGERSEQDKRTSLHSVLWLIPVFRRVVECQAIVFLGGSDESNVVKESSDEEHIYISQT